VLLKTAQPGQHPLQSLEALFILSLPPSLPPQALDPILLPPFLSLSLSLSLLLLAIHKHKALFTHVPTTTHPPFLLQVSRESMGVGFRRFRFRV
jgi:hypothetical protein